jgi:uncharacterized hydrophobic protein (TIGR00271 family)
MLRSRHDTRAEGLPLLHWWSLHAIQDVDHHAVVEKVQNDGGWSGHFAFMTLMSAGIAMLGLLLSSPAVVIGAMLISPLMGPIIALGFAVATFDSVELRRSAFALSLGIVMAVLFCASIVAVSPIQTVTSEIASRTRPNLFDLLVALFSGLAGTYAMIRGRHGAIVGVAIATALMPPLAVVGFGFATLNWAVLGGSLLLFFTNLMTIAVAAAVLARVYGFASGLSPRQTHVQAAFMIAVMLALTIPLGLALRQIAWEALVTREARQMLESAFADGRVSQFTVDFRATPVEIGATVLTPTYKPDAERVAGTRLQKLLSQPVNLSIDQVRTQADAAEATQIATAGLATGERTVARLSEQLAIAAGVATQDILIDTRQKHAQVRAAVLPGANMLAYQALEARIAATRPGWRIKLVPPAAVPLEPVPFDSGEIGAEGRAMIAAAVWAAQRLQLTVEVRAAERTSADAVLRILTEQGVAAVLGEPSNDANDTAQLRLIATVS